MLTRPDANNASVVPQRPSLSVVINVLLGGSFLRRCIQALLTQHEPPRTEIIVPVGPWVSGLEQLRREYDRVRFIDVDRLPGGADISHPGRAHLIYERSRACGLAAATADIIALTEDQMIPDPTWCRSVVEAHSQLSDIAAIGGVVQHAGNGRLHYALYLSDFGTYEKPLSRGPAASLTDNNVSYKRFAVDKVRHVWHDLYHEPAVHQALLDAGESLWISPECVVRLDRGSLRFWVQMRERFAWWRVFGGRRTRHISGHSRYTLLLLSPALPIMLLWRRTRASLRKSRSPVSLLTTIPALMAMITSWTMGEAMGYLTGEAIPLPAPSLPKAQPVARAVPLIGGFLKNKSAI